MRWWWVVILTLVVGIGAAFVTSSLMTPIYEADATVLIEHQLDTGRTNFESIQAAERRTQTFSQLVTSRPVLVPVIENLELPYSYSDLEENVSVSHTRETQLVRIAVRDPDPDLAAAIANAINVRFTDYVRETQAPPFGDLDADVGATSDELTGLMEAIQARIDELTSEGNNMTTAEQNELVQLENLYEQAEAGLSILARVDENIAEAGGRMGSQVQVAEPAVPPEHPASPRTVLNMGLAGVVSLIIGIGLVVLLGYLDDKVKVVGDIRDLVEHDVLGSIPTHQLAGSVEQLHGGQSLTSEVFQSLRTNLEFSIQGQGFNSILVTSSREEEGKTTVAANLAISLAENGKRVILVDADLRRPSVHTLFESLRNFKGLSNLLHLNSTDVDSVLQPTSLDNLKVLTTGPLPRNPATLLNSSIMSEIARSLERRADIVVFDSPPAPISDSLVLSRLADGIIFVVRAGKVRSGDFVSEVENISRAGVPIIGVVLNGVDLSEQTSLRVYQHYYSMGNTPFGDAETEGRFRWIARMLPWRV
jgi:polysaccharide biosynthesis transport protein